MKLDYSVKQLNSPFDDSVFFMRNVYRKKAFLFDCGRMSGLENSELLDISDVFVSHTHMDHFSGFDRFLRGCLGSGNRVRFFGPRGIIENVSGKLSGYTWNLIKDYDFTVEATELTPTGRKSAVFSSSSAFVRQDLAVETGPVDLGEGFTLEYEFFDHGIPSVGYRVKEPRMVSVSKEKLAGYGLTGGAWIKELKRMLIDGYDPSATVRAASVSGELDLTLRDALSFSEFKEPQDVTYITDIAPTLENFVKARRFSAGSHLLMIEAVFLKKDILHASAKNHLTVDLSKRIFIDSGSKFVKFHHFAPRYDRTRSEFYRELYSGIKNRLLP